MTRFETMPAFEVPTGVGLVSPRPEGVTLTKVIGMKRRSEDGTVSFGVFPQSGGKPYDPKGTPGDVFAWVSVPADFEVKVDRWA